jgi:hypothetical protein
MKWVTREHVKVDRVACPWLIRKFVDAHAEFLFVPQERVAEVARREEPSRTTCLGSSWATTAKRAPSRRS